jgi:ADP-heptose:LPS heptosyltransferase
MPLKPCIRVFTLQALGNSILAFPVVNALKENCEIELHLMNLTGFEFYRDLNLGIKLVLYRHTSELIFKNRTKCDFAVSLYPNWKRELFALLCASSRQKLSFWDEDYPLSRVVPWDKIKREPVHDLENNWKIVEKLNSDASYSDLASLFAKAKERKVSLHPTSSSRYKFYPQKFWVNLIQYFHSQNLEINVFCGESKEEQDFCDEILGLSNTNAKMRLFKGMSFNSVMQTIASSQVFIGLDSALAHLAAFLDIPVVVLWSFGDYTRIYPYGSDVHIYLPEERRKIKRFVFGHLKEYKSYGDSLKRADVQDIVRILEKEKKEDFLIFSKFKKPVKVYLF